MRNSWVYPVLNPSSAKSLSYYFVQIMQSPCSGVVDSVGKPPDAILFLPYDGQQPPVPVSLSSEKSAPSSSSMNSFNSSWYKNENLLPNTEWLKSIRGSSRYWIDRKWGSSVCRLNSHPPLHCRSRSLTCQNNNMDLWNRGWAFSHVLWHERCKTFFDPSPHDDDVHVDRAGSKHDRSSF